MNLVRLATLPLMFAAFNANATQYCAHDGTELQTALSLAESNNLDDEIRITTGTKTFAQPVGYPHVFGYQPQSTVDADDDLLISGGWNSGCSLMQPGAQHTVLDGQNQDADLLIVSRHSAYFIDLQGRYTIRNLTLTGTHYGQHALEVLLPFNATTTAEIVLDRVQVRGGRGGIYTYGGRVDASQLLVTGVNGGNDFVDLTPSRRGSRIVHSSIYENIVNPLLNDYCPLRITGVTLVHNNVAFGHRDGNGAVVRDACLIAANLEPTPRSYNNHFQGHFINALYWNDLQDLTNGPPQTESIDIDGYALKQPMFGTLQDSAYSLGDLAETDVFGRQRLRNGVPDRGALESTYCRNPLMASIQDLAVDERAMGGGVHPIGTLVGNVTGSFWHLTGFSITGGNSDGVFTIDSDGALRLANPALLGQQAVYDLTVEGSDVCGATSGWVRVSVTADALFASDFE